MWVKSSRPRPHHPRRGGPPSPKPVVDNKPSSLEHPQSPLRHEPAAASAKLDSSFETTATAPLELSWSSHGSHSPRRDDYEDAMLSSYTEGDDAYSFLDGMMTPSPKKKPSYLALVPDLSDHFKREQHSKTLQDDVPSTAETKNAIFGGSEHRSRDKFRWGRSQSHGSLVTGSGGGAGVLTSSPYKSPKPNFANAQPSPQRTQSAPVDGYSPKKKKVIKIRAQDMTTLGATGAKAPVDLKQVLKQWYKSGLNAPERTNTSTAPLRRRSRSRSKDEEPPEGRATEESRVRRDSSTSRRSSSRTGEDRKHDSSNSSHRSSRTQDSMSDSARRRYRHRSTTQVGQRPSSSSSREGRETKRSSSQEKKTNKKHYHSRRHEIDKDQHRESRGHSHGESHDDDYHSCRREGRHRSTLRDNDLLDDQPRRLSNTPEQRQSALQRAGITLDQLDLLSEAGFTIACKKSPSDRRLTDV